MPAVYQQAQKSKYRITIELDVMGDFNPHNIDYKELFNLDGSEQCDAYVEDLSTPDVWWVTIRGPCKVHQ